MAEDTPGPLAASIKILVAVSFIFLVIWPFWRPALWSLAVVTSLWGFRERALARGTCRWAFSAGAMTLWTALCLLIPFALITGAVTVEATSAAAKLSDPAQRAALIEAVREKAAFVTPYLSRFGVQPEELPGKAAGTMGPLMAGLVRLIAGAAGTLLIDSAFFILYTYVFFSRGKRMAETLQAALPRTAAGGLRVAGNALDSSLFGVVATATIQGAVGSLGCYVAGLPSPLLFFLAMAVASLIPGVGTLLVWGPAAGWLALNGNYIAAGGLTAWGILVIGSVDNFIRPFIASRFGSIDIIVAMLGSLGGLALFGFSGVLLGPTLLAAGIELLRKDPASSIVTSSS